jgi:hypothetical protein
MLALGTLLTGVARVNKGNRNSQSFSFVTNESLELEEAPTMQSSSMGLTALSSASDVGQILKYECCAFAYRLHQSFREYMVAITPKPLLSARHLFKMPFSRLCAFALKSATMLEGFLLNRFPSWFSIKVASAVSGRIDNTQINPNTLLRQFNLWRGGFHHQMQPPALFLVPTQIRTTTLPTLLDVLLVVLRQFERQSLAPINCGNAQLRTIKPNRVGIGIVANWTSLRHWTSCLPAFLNDRLNRLKSFRCFNSGRANQLGGQARLGFLVVVSQAVQSIAVMGELCIPTNLANLIERIGVPQTSPLEGLRYLRVWLKTQSNRSLHLLEFMYNLYYAKLMDKRPQVSVMAAPPPRAQGHEVSGARATS